MSILSYLFWPNPPATTYGNPKVIALLIVCAGLVAAWFFLKQWRKRLSNPVTKKLSGSWPVAALSFGLTGLVLTVARVEGIQFIAMRFLWVLWGAALLLFLFLQIRIYRMRHYVVLPKVKVEDPRDRYLPKKK